LYLFSGEKAFFFLYPRAGDPFLTGAFSLEGLLPAFGDFAMMDKL
jgi:hypothetical protein